MTKPIGKTPPLEGEEAIVVLKKMQEPPTEKDKEFFKINKESKDCIILNLQFKFF